VSQIPSAGAGLGAKFFVFQDVANHVIYHHFASTSGLDAELARLKAEYGFHQGAKDLFQEIYTDRKKLCVTYTRVYFTNGFVATVISEAKNASMKSAGRKSKMQKYSMSDQCKMLM
jgi:hypothetical protein